MTKVEIAKILSYLAVEHGTQITDERIEVWLDQFRHIPLQTAMVAAQILISRKTFGFPKCHDFHEALAEVMKKPEEAQEWAEAWDLWVTLSRRHGRYDLEKQLELYKAQSPIGSLAMATMAREYFDLLVEDVPTFRAQFRQRFESYKNRQTQGRTLAPALEQGHILKLLTGAQ